MDALKSVRLGVDEPGRAPALCEQYRGVTHQQVWIPHCKLQVTNMRPGVTGG